MKCLLISRLDLLPLPTLTGQKWQEKITLGRNMRIPNPNWRVAEAIRRAVKHAVGAKFLEIIALCGQIMTIRNPQLGYVYPWFVFLYCFANAFRMWGWLNYLIHGSRKHLRRSLVGFSTIGLQKSIVSTASNFVSTRSVAPPERDD